MAWFSKKDDTELGWLYSLEELYTVLLYPMELACVGIGRNIYEIAFNYMDSIEFKKALFEMNLVASDGVIQAYQDLLKITRTDPTLPNIMRQYRKVVLEMRRHLQNGTDLEETELIGLNWSEDE